jgi:hypothetical protein
MFHLIPANPSIVTNGDEYDGVMAPTLKILTESPNREQHQRIKL